MTDETEDLQKYKEAFFDVRKRACEIEKLYIDAKTDIQRLTRERDAAQLLAEHNYKAMLFEEKRVAERQETINALQVQLTKAQASARVEKHNADTVCVNAARELSALRMECDEAKAQLASITEDRDNETKWAKQYCDDMVKSQQALSHMEKVMDGMKAEIESLNAEIASNERAWMAEKEELESAIRDIYETAPDEHWNKATINILYKLYQNDND